MIDKIETEFIACVAAVSFPVPGREMKQASEQLSERRNKPGLSKNWEKEARVHLHAVSFPSPALLETFVTQATEFIRKIRKSKK